MPSDITGRVDVKARARAPHYFNLLPLRAQLCESPSLTLFLELDRASPALCVPRQPSATPLELLRR